MESAGVEALYTPGAPFRVEGAVPGRDCCVKERDVFVRAVCGLDCWLEEYACCCMSPLPEFTRM